MKRTDTLSYLRHALPVYAQNELDVAFEGIHLLADIINAHAKGDATALFKAIEAACPWVLQAVEILDLKERYREDDS